MMDIAYDAVESTWDRAMVDITCDMVDSTYDVTGDRMDSTCDMVDITLTSHVIWCG